MRKTEGPRLLIPVDLFAGDAQAGHYRITKKVLTGCQMFARLWPGPVTLAMQPGHDVDGNPDGIDVDPKQLSFDLFVGAFASAAFLAVVRQSAVVHYIWSASGKAVVEACFRYHVPLVMITELTLKTRLQIYANREAPTFFHRLAAMRRTFRFEHQEQYQLARAAGFQANGVPTYEAYRHLNPNGMLFFDSRVTKKLLVSEADQAARAERYRAQKKLKLVYSGRLTSIKGTHELPEVADALRSLGLPFALHIFGSGDQKAHIAQLIQQRGLGDVVKMEGSVDFESELMPWVAREADLFVSCHLQGDPSCTYLETFSCGVPILGYKNEALDGLLHLAPAGRVTKARPKILARAIAELASRPFEMEKMSKKAQHFAAAHTFEKEFIARVEHLQAVWERSKKSGLCHC